jgi:hypothetical protein
MPPFTSYTNTYYFCHWHQFVEQRFDLSCSLTKVRPKVQGPFLLIGRTAKVRLVLFNQPNLIWSTFKGGSYRRVQLVGLEGTAKHAIYILGGGQNCLHIHYLSINACFLWWGLNEMKHWNIRCPHNLLAFHDKGLKVRKLIYHLRLVYIVTEITLS